ncbi:TIGR03619 family F420-dependent LLM class oxidoreductase [Desertimonas flava]|uniref:TIGR03619 family F420-dependent LLM class oxidoreductase n=1 Tax=Desertimonas flava TaxID=2064846 RepID=UPI000E354027|nr:TIGR03619 family F420-dependent LLM class oxidoreductase [Desertimonas flava]
MSGSPVLGPHARPETIVELARVADRLGFSSVSLSERLLLPAGPGWTNDFGLPEWPAFDTVETLTWVAAHTERIRLRSDVIMPLFQQPVVLARRLATLDHFSRGRLDVGVGIGWLADEFAATGVPPAGRAQRFEEAIAAMRACWAADPVEFTGRHYRIPPARIGPKPLQARLSIYVGGVSRPAIERAARIGDGLTIAFRDWESTMEQLSWYRDAGGAGPIAARGGPMLADAQHEAPPATWTQSHIVESLERAAAAGIDEFLWDLNIVGESAARQIELFEWLAGELGLGSAPAETGSDVA